MEGIYNGKKVNKILLISKEIAHKLNKEFGVPFGENGISSVWSERPIPTEGHKFKSCILQSLLLKKFYTERR